MLLKAAIIILLLALVISLFSGFYFLMVDQGDKDKRRTVNSLGLRVSLAACLIALVVYGVATGQIRSQAPWETPRAAAPDTETAPQGAPLDPSAP